MDHVDDGFYKGDFCWAIVDTDDLENLFEVKYDPEKYSLDSFRDKRVFSIRESEGILVSRSLAVKEKQVISGIIPSFVEETQGTLNVCGVGDSDSKYEICFFKTGQEIDIPVKEYEYIGLCRLWIVQELALYTFAHKVK